MEHNSNRFEKIVKPQEKAAWYREDRQAGFEDYAQLCETVADRLEKEEAK